MNIAPISFKLFQNNKPVQNNNYTDNRLIKPNYKNQLTQDTVSFQAATYKAISDTIENKYVKEAPRLKRIATTFLDTVESVANKFKEYGVSFVREMFEGTAVKEVDSKMSKIVRAKTFDDRDAIRTTLFIKNPYDLSILFDKIIPELGPQSDRIYKVARIPMSVGDLMERGYIPIDEIDLIKQFFEIPNHNNFSHLKYFSELRKLKYDYDDTKKLLAQYLKPGKKPNKDDIIKIAKTLKKDMPDIDIRLNKKLLDTSSIPEEYQYCVGKPHGPYEDIQIRFVRTTESDKEKPIYHELLIHFGPTYNRNAFKEHKWVYEPLRLFSELNIPIKENIGRYVNFDEYPEQGVAKNMADIKDMFRTKVSDKLINNGKNVDYYGNNDEDEIYFLDDEIEKFEKKMKSLKYHLKKYYGKQKSSAESSDIAKIQIEKEERADIKLVNKIWRKLEDTIFNVSHEYGLKE